MIIVICLGAACLLGLGFVAQQHVAYREPLEEILHPRLLLDLIRTPLWLIGIGLMLCGQILSATALRETELVRVEPLLATNLLFALTAAHVIYQEHFGPMEWVGAVLVSGGVALFLLFGEPRAGHLPDPVSPRLLTLILVVMVAAGLVLHGLRCSLQTKATLLAAAGLLYGIQDVLTRSSLLTLGKGLDAVAETWQPYAIFAERLRVSQVALAGMVTGLIAMVVGIVILGRSPFLAKSQQDAVQRRDEGAQ
ncbi:DMT family transporter [Sphaerisporangium viridialbum]|uniref:DMT family transporter n=1 Tax=Sphaerisporangium viridialbum TaxID=46189 RepID=UPI003C737711